MQRKKVFLRNKRRGKPSIGMFTRRPGNHILNKPRKSRKSLSQHLPLTMENVLRTWSRMVGGKIKHWFGEYSGTLQAQAERLLKR